jgi:hypothetical protein
MILGGVVSLVAGLFVAAGDEGLKTRRIEEAAELDLGGVPGNDLREGSGAIDANDVETRSQDDEEIATISQRRQMSRGPRR